MHFFLFPIHPLRQPVRFIYKQTIIMNQNLHERYHIARLIAKSLSEQATEEEQHRLQEWIKASPRHAREYTEWMRRLPHDLAAEELSPRMAWKQFNRRRLPRPLRTFKAVSLYACAAFLLLAALFGGIAYYHHETPAATAIVPGSAKARLTIGNGEDIDINPQLPIEFARTKAGETIRNEDGVLHYDHISLPADSLKETFHTLDVPKGGEYRIVLADGTYIHLNSDSRIKYPVVFTETDSLRQVSIEGEAYFCVAANAQKPFVVHTRHGSIRVLGTRFNVHDYADEEQAVVTLAEGSISYTVEGNGCLLRPNEQAVYGKSTGQLHRRAVDASIYTAWIDGIFEFNGMPLELIMKQLARWYDVDYRFENPRLKQHQFTGITYRRATLESLLSLIEKTTSIRFEIRERTIYIY